MLEAAKARNPVRRCTRRPIPLCTFDCCVYSCRVNPIMRQFLFLQQQRKELKKMMQERLRAANKPRKILWLSYPTPAKDTETNANSEQRTTSNYSMGLIGMDAFRRISPEMHHMLKENTREMDELLATCPRNEVDKLRSVFQRTPRTSVLDEVNPALANYLRHVMEHDNMHNLNYFPKAGEDLCGPEVKVKSLDDYLLFRDIATLLEFMAKGGTLTTEQLTQLLRFLAALCQLEPASIKQYFQMLRAYGVLSPEIMAFMKRVVQESGLDIPMDKLTRLFKAIDSMSRRLEKEQRKYGESTLPPAYNSKTGSYSPRNSTGSTGTQRNSIVSTGSTASKGPKRSGTLSTGGQSRAKLPPDSGNSLFKLKMQGSIADSRIVLPWSYVGSRHKDVRKAYFMSMAATMATLQNVENSIYKLTPREEARMKHLLTVQSAFPRNLYRRETKTTPPSPPEGITFKLPVEEKRPQRRRSGTTGRRVSSSQTRKSFPHIPPVKYELVSAEPIRRKSIPASLRRGTIFASPRQKRLPSFMLS